MPLRPITLPPSKPNPCIQPKSKPRSYHKWCIHLPLWARRGKLLPICHPATSWWRVAMDELHTLDHSLRAHHRRIHWRDCIGVDIVLETAWNPCLFGHTEGSLFFFNGSLSFKECCHNFRCSTWSIAHPPISQSFIDHLGLETVSERQRDAPLLTSEKRCPPVLVLCCVGSPEEGKKTETRFALQIAGLARKHPILAIHS